MALDRFKIRGGRKHFPAAPSREFSTVGRSNPPHRPHDSAVQGQDDPRVAYKFLADARGCLSREYSVTFEQVDGKEPPPYRNISFPRRRRLNTPGFGSASRPELDLSYTRFTSPPRMVFLRDRSLKFLSRYWKQNYNLANSSRKIVVIWAEGLAAYELCHLAVWLRPGPELHLNAINAAVQGAFIENCRPRPAAGRPRWHPSSRWPVVFRVHPARLAVPRPTRLLHGERPCRLQSKLAFPANGRTFPLSMQPSHGPHRRFGLGTARKKRLRRTLEIRVKNVVPGLLDQPKLSTRNRCRRCGPPPIRSRIFADIPAREKRSSALVAQLNEYLTAMVEAFFALAARSTIHRRRRHCGLGNTGATASGPTRPCGAGGPLR